ncbi:hypothetical protein PHPALM_30424 [Phytophthora palmivora]|uniref:Uncharacterized protein n=1 Tax=Phytophthora palmivora TaxID=4796 RepID=A0A2P4X573_9STRA|nr:hypothetical protein PHPALM_30424 [Phytophthora palmivora]
MHQVPALELVRIHHRYMSGVDFHDQLRTQSYASNQGSTTEGCLGAAYYRSRLSCVSISQKVGQQEDVQYSAILEGEKLPPPAMHR